VIYVVFGNCAFGWYDLEGVRWQRQMFTVPKQVRKCTYSILIYIYIYIQQDVYRYTVYFIWKLLYMFRVVPPPIIRSVNNCIYSILYLSDRYCYPPL